MSTTRKFTLISCDGKSFEVDKAVAMESQTIKHMIEDGCADNDIPVTNVAGNILAKTIEYCAKHADSAIKTGEEEDGTAKADDDVGPAKSTDEELKTWDAEFVNVDQLTLFGLILAANYLNIKGLLELTCQAVADMIKGIKDPEEIRKIFSIKNDFSPEEEAEVRKENQWAFED